MSTGIADTLEADRASLRLFPKAYAARLGISVTALNALTRSPGGRPSAKVVAALCRAFGPERAREWFPHVTRLDLLLAVVSRSPRLAAFAHRVGVSSRTLQALVYDGTIPAQPAARAIAAELGLASLLHGGEDVAASLPTVLPVHAASPLPPPPRHGPYSTTDVVQLLLRLHLEIRCGRVVPTWPVAPDYAPFDQVLAEFQHCTMHLTDVCRRRSHDTGNRRLPSPAP